ncbi:HepT-like ribonuclease domain-containing protein [Algoriphagus terrigena]|uniref:HepT-like ribonuclease domain-containing protein n=1 Tax=Algoriphagus terrigena TaxID=344884 RepID=UPI00316AC37C
MERRSKNCLTRNQQFSSLLPKKIIGLRNRISHAYDSIEDELIWGIIQRDIPSLKKEIQRIRLQ